MHILRMPQLDSNSDEYYVSHIQFQNISRIQANEMICQVESSKAVYDFEAPQDGYIKLFRQEGDLVKTNEIVGVITQDVAEVQNLTLENFTQMPCSEKSADHITKGALLELEQRQISVDQFLAFAQTQIKASEKITREKVKELLVLYTKQESHTKPNQTETPQTKYRVLRELSRFEKEQNAHLVSIVNDIVPVWVRSTFECSQLEQRLAAFNHKNSLNVPFFDLLLWASLKLIDRKPNMANFVLNNHLNQWSVKGVSIVIRSQDGVILPSLMADSQIEDPMLVSEKFFELKRRVITNTLKASDFSAGGLLLSYIPNSDIEAFNAYPAKHHGYALAINGPYNLNGQRLLSLCLTYDHRLSTAEEIALFLREYTQILKDWA